MAGHRARSLEKAGCVVAVRLGCLGWSGGLTPETRVAARRRLVTHETEAS
jgi:hypothetical protein